MNPTEFRAGRLLMFALDEAASAIRVWAPEDTLPKPVIYTYPGGNQPRYLRPLLLRGLVVDGVPAVPGRFRLRWDLTPKGHAWAGVMLFFFELRRAL